MHGLVCQDLGSSSHFLSKNSRFEGLKFSQSLSQNSRFGAIWTAGLSTNSGFEGVTEQNYFEAPCNVTEHKDPIAGKGAGFICKQVHGLFLDSIGLSNIKFMECFLLRECDMPTLSKVADLRPKQ